MTLKGFFDIQLSPPYLKTAFCELVKHANLSTTCVELNI